MNHSKWRLLAASLGVFFLTSAYLRTSAVPTLTHSAKAFLNSMTDDQKRQATFQFQDDERLNWHFIPKERKGLTIGQMSPFQRHLATALLASGLSQSGVIKATTIMSLEEVLRIMEKDTTGRRNPEKYPFSVFGNPSETGTWGYRIEGHHMSLNFTVHAGKVAAGPMFFGANPHEVREGPRAGLRVLAAEEDLGRELMMALDAGQRKTATVAAEAYKDILTEASRKVALQGQPNGLPAAKMNAKQRELLNRLIDEYVMNVPDQIAQYRREKIKKSGPLHFAWAGPVEKGAPHYYRVQGSTFLIEYDNTQNNANHSHTVWREMDGDFGLDLLKEHYQSSHTR
ncbi:MAG: DUF3500 domain-containing protein [Candidatus Hydrogenedentes bacterium]|nr:DUF3500 domain-containing protein [Candidatus Hydrogenedentota bacterium]